MKSLIASIAFAFLFHSHPARAEYGVIDRGYMTYWKSCDEKGVCEVGNSAAEARSNCNASSSTTNCKRAVYIKQSYKFGCWEDCAPKR